ncbi:hypothetical protein FISHEDRAFT_58185 [Fistulina hepatica ATCC 64428]|nr:hypothetical protein FISHEDRAFT_58185 [Fistulina hepatica ATCC 64428]
MKYVTDPETFPAPGKPLKPLYGYSAVEIFSFATDTRYQKAIKDMMGDAGLPENLLAAVAAFRVANRPPTTTDASGTKDKEKTPSTWKHSVAAVKLKPMVFGRRLDLTYPNDYLFAAKHLIPIPLVILRTKVIADFISKHDSIPMKKRNVSGPADEVITQFFIDNNAICKKFGEDNTMNVSYYSWCDAMHNFLEIIKFLLDDGPEIYEHWFAIERYFAEQIRTHHAFNADVYTSEVRNAIDASRIQKLEEQLAHVNSGSKRSYASYPQSDRSAKKPRHSFRHGHQPNKHQDNHRQKDCSALTTGGVCLICLEGHKFRQHPPMKTKSPSGKEYFSKLVDGALVRASDGRTICISWNIYGRGSRCCAPGGHGRGRLDICSFCGSWDHGLLKSACLSSTTSQ